MLGSHFRLDGDARFLLGVLPPVVLLESDAQKESLRWAVERLLQEMRDPQPGSTLITQHVAYMMLVEALRLHVVGGMEKDPGLLSTLADKRLRAALSLAHREPARAWTLGALAPAAGVSRMAFAQLFKQKVGKTPLVYLTHWRMNIAVKQLEKPGASISSVASAVGYKSESAFSAAFRRVRGSSPREHIRTKSADESA